MVARHKAFAYGAALIGVIAYVAWALFDAHPFNGGNMILSCGPFSFGIARYWWHARFSGADSPEKLVFGDPFLQACGVAWLAIVLAR
jgi:hypothetical protein